MPKLQINGDIREFTPEEFPALLSELLKMLGLNEVAIIAEIDGKIVKKESFALTQLTDGMKIELVKFVGGG